MPRWTITLHYWNARQEITCEDGELACPNPDMLDMIRLEAEATEGQSVGPIPTGSYTATEHL
jgi:hypothetical protein